MPSTPSALPQSVRCMLADGMPRRVVCSERGGPGPQGAHYPRSRRPSCRAACPVQARGEHAVMKSPPVASARRPGSAPLQAAATGVSPPFRGRPGSPDPRFHVCTAAARPVPPLPVLDQRPGNHDGERYQDEQQGVHRCPPSGQKAGQGQGQAPAGVWRSSAAMSAAVFSAVLSAATAAAAPARCRAHCARPSGSGRGGQMARRGRSGPRAPSRVSTRRMSSAVV